MTSASEIVAVGATTHYDETVYGYDSSKRQNRLVTPGGTITRTVYDARGNPWKSFVGTNDTGATESDPTGGGQQHGPGDRIGV